MPTALIRAGEPQEIAPPRWVNDLTPIAAGEWNRTRAAHLLERAGFGGTPEEVNKLAAMTPEQAVNYLVDFESIDEGNRKLGLRTLPGVPGYGDTTGALGQMLFFPPNVAGWAGGRAWINPATLLARGNFIHTLLSPDPESYGAPDKVVAEGYRKIPVMFPEYHIVPHIWDSKSQKMRPVSLVEYDKYLAGIDSGSVKSMGAAERSADKVSAAKPSGDRQPAEPAMMASGKDGKSMMSQVANGEKYNLALGVYTGFVEAANRVKPIARMTAEIDFTAMIRDAKVSNAEDAVDYLAHRFLSVKLHADRHAAIVSFLKNELSSDSLDDANKNLADALRRTVHLLLSAPEYQLE